MIKNSITNYTKDEFLDFIKDIHRKNRESVSDEVLFKMIDHFEEISEHPDGSDLIYYSEGYDATPEGVVDAVKKWRIEQGLPCFKDD